MVVGGIRVDEGAVSSGLHATIDMRAVTMSANLDFIVFFRAGALFSVRYIRRAVQGLATNALRIR
ncbi:MAG: hypothetical protein EBY45_03460 [Gammaproteobacteria bacterium]|nr:hypothetical protein [Gammaproteobacteria bacterium]